MFGSFWLTEAISPTTRTCLKHLKTLTCTTNIHQYPPTTYKLLQM
jgi:hypothetical protein